MIRGTVIMLNGKAVRQSRNLRGMLDYARVSPVARAELRKAGAGGILAITYLDGATCEARFGSHVVMLDFVRRRHSWRGAELVTYDDRTTLRQPL